MDARTSPSEIHCWVLPTPIFVFRGKKGNYNKWVGDWCSSLGSQLEDLDGASYYTFNTSPLPIPVQTWASQHVSNFIHVNCWATVACAIGGCQFTAIGGGSEYRFAQQCEVVAVCIQLHGYRVSLGPPRDRVVDDRADLLGEGIWGKLLRRANLRPNGEQNRVPNVCVCTHWDVEERVRERDLEIVPTYTACDASQFPYPPPSFPSFFLDGNAVNAPG
jgi:hypothetical protein